MTTAPITPPLSSGPPQATALTDSLRDRGASTMPSHVAVVYLTIALVPLASALTCVYALSTKSRA